MNQDNTNTVDTILSALMQGDDTARLQANIDAAQLPSTTVSILARIYMGEDRVRSKTAGEMLKMMAHHAARPGANGEDRKMTGELSKLTNNMSSKNMRLLAIDLLGYVGGTDAIPTLSKELMDPDVQDVARMALERIPSHAAETALHTALRNASPEFQKSLQLSIEHKRMTFKTVGDGH